MEIEVDMKTALLILFALAPCAAAQESAQALSSLGAQFYHAADYKNAESKLRQALAISPDDETRAGLLFNLAADLRMQSRLPEAEELYKRAIALRETISGPDAPELARALAGLALAFIQQGDLSSAAESAERAVRVSANTSDARQSASARNSLCTLLLLRAQPARAGEIERHVIEELKKSDATESHEYVDALTNLASSRLALQDLPQAELDLLEAEAIALRIAGPAHPLTAAIWNNLGKVLAAKGESKPAEALYRKAIDAWRISLGPNHPNVACGLANLAALYQARKDYAAADRLYREAIRTAESALGPDSLTVANYWNDLGALEEARHRHRDAEAAIAKALAITEKRVGSDHPDTARIAVNLAIVEYGQARYADACGLFSKALPVKERILGADSPELATILRLYADSLRGIHDYADAERTDLRATRILTRNALRGQATAN